MILAFIGIVLAVIILNVVVYKGLNAVVASFLTAMIVIVTSGLDFNQAMNESIAFVGGICGSFLPIIVFGGIIGALYNASNATKTLTKLIIKPIHHIKSPAGQRIAGVGLILLIRIVIGLSGIDNMAIMTTMVALTATVFAALDWPRKYIACVLMVAGTVGALIPGAPNLYVIILQQVLTEFDNQGTLFIRWLILIVFTVGAALMIARMIGKAQESGVHFEPGSLQVPDLEAVEKAPHWIVTFIPVIAVFVFYNLLGLEAWVALLIGAAVAVVCFVPYIQPKQGSSRIRALLDAVNSGTFSVPLSLVGIMLVSNVLAMSPAMSSISNYFAQLPLPGSISLMLISILLVGGMGGAQAALVVMGTMALQYYIPNGMGVQTAGVIALWATTVLDTLPSNLGIAAFAELTDVTIEESYPPIFQTTVVFTLVICVLVALLGVTGIMG